MNAERSDIIATRVARPTYLGSCCPPPPSCLLVSQRVKPSGGQATPSLRSPNRGTGLGGQLTRDCLPCVDPALPDWLPDTCWLHAYLMAAILPCGGWTERNGRRERERPSEEASAEGQDGWMGHLSSQEQGPTSLTAPPIHNTLRESLGLTSQGH